MDLLDPRFKAQRLKSVPLRVAIIGAGIFSQSAYVPLVQYASSPCRFVLQSNALMCLCGYRGAAQTPARARTLPVWNMNAQQITGISNFFSACECAELGVLTCCCCAWWVPPTSRCSLSRAAITYPQQQAPMVAWSAVYSTNKSPWFTCGAGLCRARKRSCLPLRTSCALLLVCGGPTNSPRDRKYNCGIGISFFCSS